jgi:hypothetical protein
MAKNPKDYQNPSDYWLDPELHKHVTGLSGDTNLMRYGAGAQSRLAAKAGRKAASNKPRMLVTQHLGGVARGAVYRGCNSCQHLIEVKRAMANNIKEIRLHCARYMWHRRGNLFDRKLIKGKRIEYKPNFQSKTRPLIRPTVAVRYRDCPKYELLESLKRGEK